LRRELIFGPFACPQRSGSLPGTGKTGDRTLQQRCIDTGDTGGLAGTKDTPYRGLLLFVHLYITFPQLAAKQGCQLGVGDKVKAARNHVTGLLPGLHTVCQVDTLKQSGARIRRHLNRPAASPVRSRAKRHAIFDSLPEL
jgi:hypothetical protein